MNVWIIVGALGLLVLHVAAWLVQDAGRRDLEQMIERRAKMIDELIRSSPDPVAAMLVALEAGGYIGVECADDTHEKVEA